MARCTRRAGGTLQAYVVGGALQAYAAGTSHAHANSDRVSQGRRLLDRMLSHAKPHRLASTTLSRAGACWAVLWCAGPMSTMKCAQGRQSGTKGMQHAVMCRGGNQAQKECSMLSNVRGNNSLHRPWGLVASQVGNSFSACYMP